MRIHPPVDEQSGAGGRSDLASPGVITVPCAPQVPCGVASATLLKKAGERLTPASEEQNVSAVVTRVVEKQANAGLVYATDIAANAGKLEGIEPAGADAVVNRYPIAAVAGSGHADAGRAFVELVLSTRGRAVLASYGFLPPTAG